MKDFWFKFFAKDYLLDLDVQSLPLPAQAILVRIWCVCCIHGSVPAALDKMAAGILLTESEVAPYYQAVVAFFQRKGDRLISVRMEQERRARLKTSEGASKAARTRWRAAESHPPSSGDDLEATSNVRAVAYANAHASSDALADAEEVAAGDAVQSTEYKFKNSDSKGQQPEEGTPADPSTGLDASIFKYLPCKGRGNEPAWWPVRHSDIQEWQDAYPKVNVPGQILSLGAWLEEHGDRRPAISSMGRWVLSCLAKARTEDPSPSSRAAGTPIVQAERSRVDTEHVAQIEEYARRQEARAASLTKQE